MAEFDNFIQSAIEGYGEDWREHNGAEVQEFLERMLRKHAELISANSSEKVGDVRLYPGEDGQVMVRFFSDVDTRETWESDPTKHAALLLGSLSFRVSDAGGDDYTLAARVTKMPDSPSVKGSENTLTFSYNSYYGGDPTNLDTETGVANVTVNGTEISALARTLRPGNDYTIDLGPYLTGEHNTVTLTVANAHGKRRVWNLTVETVEISVAFDPSYDETLVRDAGWALRVRATGVESTLHLIVDGTERGTATVHNATKDFIIDEYDTYASGAHTIEIYAENTGYSLRSDTIMTHYIKRGLSVPTICIGREADRYAKLYATATIPYFIHYPTAKAGDTIAVTGRVLDPQGGAIRSGITQSITFAKDAESGQQTLRLALTEHAYLSAGSITIEITCGNRTASHTIEVLDPGVNLQAASECKIHLSAAGKTNSDSDAETWKSAYNGKTTCEVVRSEGFRLTDKAGFTGDSFYIPTGRKVTLKGCRPFAKDFGANAASTSDRTGKTIELEFATHNCTDSHALVAECMSGGVGFRIWADGMELRTANETVKTIWADETRLRIGIVIEGTTRHCVNKTVDGSTERDANVAMIYVNGVPVRVMDYGDSHWEQPEAQDMTVGSDECDVEEYTVRVYDKALSTAQMIQNYAFDTPDPEEKIAIAKRNDILDSYGEVSFAKVREALPMTPYKIWTIDKMPTGKKDWQKASTEFVNPGWNPSEDDLTTASFTAINHDIALDGTSSLSYPDPYKNWADKYGSGVWTVAVGDKVITISEYSITPGTAGGESEFVDKVNFASSEGFFNILSANAYQRVLLGVAGSYPSILTPMQAAQQAEGREVTLRQSLSGFPEIGWLREYDNGVPSVRFLSLFNFVNNKYSGTPYGATVDNGTEMWEVEDNVNFFSEHCDEGQWAGGKWNDRLTTLYYARFPKTDTAGNDTGKASNAEGVDAANAQSRHMRAFHNFIFSCNPTIAERTRLKTGSYTALAAPVTYGSKTYAYDTPEYRIARFRAEAEQWLDKPSALFYMLFFGSLLGVDSMDKNMTVTLTKPITQ